MAERWLEWQVSGPALKSFEVIYPNQMPVLAVDYTDNVDTRWEGLACLGPENTGVVCSTYDGATSPANANGCAPSDDMNATFFLYVIRGRPVAKIQVSDMTLVGYGAGSPLVLTEAGTSIVKTRTSAGTQEIAFGMAATAYHVITAVAAAGTADTASANDSSEIMRVLAMAAEGVAVGGNGQTWKRNFLTGTVTMDAPNWVELTTLAGETTTPTGFVFDDGAYILGTSNGPYLINARTLKPEPLIPEMPNDPVNCAQMTTWYPSEAGVLIPTRKGLRNLAGGGGRSIGVETYRGNTSPVQGRVTGLAGADDWLFVNWYNPVTGETYVCAARPREPGAWHGEPFSWYPLMTFINTSSDFLYWLGTANGVRTNPTLVGGSGSNIFWSVFGRTSRDIDDSNYRFNTGGGTLYLTEARFPPGQYAVVKEVVLESDDCAAARTLTVTMNSVTRLGEAVATQVGAAINADGFQRLRAWDTIQGHRLKPQIAFASNVNTASPQIRGTLRVLVDVREYGDE